MGSGAADTASCVSQRSSWSLEGTEEWGEAQVERGRAPHPQRHPPETELQHSAGWGELARWSTQEEEMVGVPVRDGQVEEGQVAEEDPDGRGGEDR